MICAYLMNKNDWSFDKALKFVQTKRWIACPNSGFQKQLKDFETEQGYGNGKFLRSW
jgi:protein-tyrosine phosphatase